MTDRTLTRLAWSLCGVGLASISLTLVLILLGWSTPPQGHPPWRDQAVTLVGIVGAPILGGLIASRRPRNPYGWLWLGFGLGLALQQFAASYAAYALAAGSGSLVAPQTIPRVLGASGPLALSLAPYLFLLFPTGRLPSHRWRFLAWSAATAGTVLVTLNFLFARPDKVGGTITIVTIAAVMVLFVSVFLAALSIVARYRRASGVERQQLKWFAFAAVVAGVYVVGQLLLLDLLLGDTLWNLLDAATNTLLYVAVGVAILRHRLYDIDVVINRALVYGLLTVSLALVYFGGVLSLQGLLRALTGQGSQLAIVASTLAIAALFNPLRRRVQSFIDQRFYRRKYDAAKTLEAYSARLRDETDLDELSNDLVRVVRETVQPEHAGLWLREPEKPG